jgi:hypothetical protein
MLQMTIGRDGFDRWRTAACGEELVAEGEHYAEFTLLSGTGDTFFGVMRAGRDLNVAVRGARAAFNTTDGWMYHCKKGHFVHQGQEQKMVREQRWPASQPSY